MLVRPSGKSNFNVLFLGLKLTRKSSLKGIIISLVPFIPVFIRDVDLKEKRIYIKTIEGLL